MNFSLTEEQVMIRESAQTFLSETCDSESVRAAMALPQGFDPAVWQSISQELGWCGLPVSEQHGGLGLGAVELMLVQEQAGYRLLPSPFFSSACLATSLLLHAADEATQAQWCGDLAVGEKRLTADLPSSEYAWAASPVKAEQGADGWVLSGVLPRVPDAEGADGLLLTAQTSDGLGLFLVEALQDSSVDIQSLDTWDNSRRFSSVTLKKTAATSCAQDDLAHGLRKAAALLRLYLAAEQLGCAQRCLDITVDYVLERKQFGRAVGSFQAVKHRCAQMMVACESTRSAVYGAAALAASAPDLEALEMETGAARALATESLQFCAAEAIQLHGGVGFTWEYDPQLFFKRAQASSHALGNPDQLRALMAQHLLD